MVSAGLESHYGIPREASEKLSESLVQALVGTALDRKHIRDVDDFFKKLAVEFSAAFIGKTAHQGAESALTSAGIESSIERALPLLAGKFAGISTAVARGKIPSPAQTGKLIIERSRDDTIKLLRSLRTAPVANFSESLPSESYLADLSLLLYLLHKE